MTDFPTPDDEVLIMCSDADAPQILKVPGTTTMQCYDCKRDVNVAPTSVQALKDYPKAKLICFKCMLARDPNATASGRLPGQGEEAMQTAGFPIDIDEVINILKSMPMREAFDQTGTPLNAKDY